MTDKPIKLRLGKPFFVFLLLHFKEFFLYYLGAITCLTLLNFFQSELPSLAKKMGDLAQAGRLSELSLGYFFLLALAILFFRTLSRLLFFLPARVQQKYLRNECIWRLSHTPPKQYKDYSSGQIFQTIYNDLNRLRGFVGFACLQLANMLIALFIFLPKIREVHPDLIYAYSPFLGGMLIFSVVLTFFARYEKRGADLQGDLQNFIMESYSGSGTIKNFQSQEFFIKNFARLSWRELELFFKASLGRIFSMPLMRACLGASFLWGAYIVQNRDLGASTLVFFTGFLFLLYEPLMFFSWIGVISSNAWASWRRIREFISFTAKEEIEKPYKKPSTLPFEVSFWGRNQSFHFDTEKSYGLCGKTGSGKSFFLLELAEEIHRRRISYSLVFQEPYLYNGTLGSNLFLGIEASLEKKQLAKNLLEIFFLEDLITGDKFLDLPLGENGKRLSGGEAKRVCLIRSLLSENQILLWDDPFSSVDVVQEKKIWDELEEGDFLKGKWLVFTAHRYSSIEKSKNIIFMEKGRGMTYFGETRDLLRKGHKVYEYFKAQFI